MLLSMRTLVSLLLAVCSIVSAAVQTDNAYTVAVISNNRFESLRRLMDSLLQTKNPLKRRIDLLLNLEASTSEEIQDYVYGLQWPFGEKTIRVRVIQGGLIRAVLESWYPSHDSDYGVLLEDDIEVSPLWLIWTEKMLSGLRSGAFQSHMSNRTIGISLYSPKLTETVFPKTIFDSKPLTLSISGDRLYPYFMQTPCSWGAVFFPIPWRSFLSYARHRLSRESTDRPVIVPNSRTNGWKQSWKKFMFELMWMKGQFMLYPNFPDELSFSTNHMEVGEHVVASDNKKLFTVGLLKDEKVLNALHVDSSRKAALLDCFGQPLLYPDALREQLFQASEASEKSPRGTMIIPSRQHLDVVPREHVICSNREDIIRSETNYEGFFYQATIQSSDGNFVIYKQRPGDDSVISTIWATHVYSKHALCLYVARGGALFLVDSTGDIVWATIKVRGNATFASYAPNIAAKVDFARHKPPDSVLLYPLLRLESNGNLVLYRSASADASCDRRGVIWSAMPYRQYPPQRCQPVTAAPLASGGATTRMQAQRLGPTFCENFPNETNAFVSSQHGVTLILSAMDDLPLLFNQVMYYSQSPLVSTIVVIWNKMKIPPIKTSVCGGKFVYFVQRKKASLNNIFTPSMLITTDAILIIDEATKIDVQDIHVLFTVWQRYPRNIVGFDPHSVRRLVDGSNRHASREARKLKGYDFMSSKAAVFHRDLLEQYTCNSFTSPLLDLVDTVLSCEDIVMNGVASLVSFSTLLGQSPPLFVEPTHLIGDFGKATNRTSLRAAAGGDYSICFDSMTKRYQHMNGSEYRMQTNMVRTKVSKDASIVTLSLGTYEELPKQQFRFCPSLETHLVECTFNTHRELTEQKIVWN